MIAALHIEFNSYMQSIIEANNNANVPFILLYIVGQTKIIILFVASNIIIILVYYYVKLLLKAFKHGFKFGKRSNSSSFRKIFTRLEHLKQKKSNVNTSLLNWYYHLITINLIVINFLPES